jgi:hypothetical protein
MIIYLIVCTNLRTEVIIMRCKKAIREKKGILSNSKIMALNEWSSNNNIIVNKTVGIDK